MVGGSTCVSHGTCHPERSEGSRCAKNRDPSPAAQDDISRGSHSAFAFTYLPGAGSITGWVAFPGCAGAATRSPAKRASHSAQFGHQLPGSLRALSSHSSASSAVTPSTQWLRFFFSGALITPAMCPLAPSTNVVGPPSRCFETNAVRHGTMWSSRDAYKKAGTFTSARSIGTSQTTTLPDSRSLFSRYPLRSSQHAIGPLRLVLSEFQ